METIHKYIEKSQKPFPGLWLFYYFYSCNTLDGAIPIYFLNALEKVKASS